MSWLSPNPPPSNITKEYYFTLLKGTEVVSGLSLFRLSFDCASYISKVNSPVMKYGLVLGGTIFYVGAVIFTLDLAMRILEALGHMMGSKECIEFARQRKFTYR